MIPTRQQWSKWSLPSKHGAIGLLVGVLSLIISGWAIWEFNIRRPADAENSKFHNLLFQSVHELRSTRDALCDLSNGLDRLALGPAYPELPVGRPKVSATIELAKLYHNRITKHFHGEEKYIFQLFLRLSDATNALESAQTWDAVTKFSHNSDMSVVDVLFLASFLNWYLRPFAEEALTDFELASLGWQPFPEDDISSVCNVDPNQIRFFRYDGKPVTNFGSYLGLID